MYDRVCKKLKPWERAASNWPFAIELRPPRIISAITEDVYSIRASAPRLIDVPKCSIKIHTSIHKSSGVLRKISMYAAATARAALFP